MVILGWGGENEFVPAFWKKLWTNGGVGFAV